MNINTLLKCVDYDTDKFITFDYHDSNNDSLKCIGFGETPVFAVFDTITAEVLYLYVLPEGAEEASAWYTDDFAVNDVTKCDEKEILELVQERLSVDKDVYIELAGFEPDTLAALDDMAAKADITRNSMIIKIIRQKADEVIEKSTQTE